MFAWRYIDGSGNQAGESEAFEDQEAAESWLSQEWSRLRSRGIEAVVLFDRGLDKVVYRMSLAPEAG